MSDIILVTGGTSFLDAHCTLDEDYIGNSAILYKGKTVVKNTQSSKGTIVFTNSRKVWQPSPWPWRDLIRKHENATTTLEGLKYHIIANGFGSVTATWRGWDPYQFRYRTMRADVRGCVVGYTAAPIDTGSYSPQADAISGAKLKLLKKLRNLRTSFDGSTFLGELGEALRMIRRPAQTFRSGLDDYFRTVKKRVHRSNRRFNTVQRIVSGTWLEYAFGWTPLVNDIESAKEALVDKFDKFENAYRYFSSQYDTSYNYSPWTTYAYTAGTRPFIITSRYRRYYNSSVRYYGEVFVASTDSMSGLRKHFGLTLNDFVPTIWELIPYSFVVDYFTNIGDIISAASTFTGDVRWLSTSIVNEGVVEHEAVSVSMNPNIVAPSLQSGLIIVSDFANQTALSVRRVRRSQASLPTINPFVDFRLKVPGLTSTKWINLAALLASGRSTSRSISNILVPLTGK